MNGSGSSYFPRDESAPLAAGTGAGSTIPMSMSNTSMASRPGASNRDSMAYQNIPSEQYWNEPSRFSTGPLANNSNEEDYAVPAGRSGGGWSNKKKWIVGGVILGVLAVAGIVAGVVVSQTRGKGSSGGSGSGSSGSGSGGDGTVEQTDPNDPSTFTKDSRLHQSFWAMAYTPQVSRAG